MRPVSVNILEAQKKPISNPIGLVYIYRNYRVRVHFTLSLSAARPS
jgi:hypothetical protein